MCVYVIYVFVKSLITIGRGQRTGSMKLLKSSETDNSSTIKLQTITISGSLNLFFLLPESTQNRKLMLLCVHLNTMVTIDKWIISIICRVVGWLIVIGIEIAISIHSEHTFSGGMRDRERECVNQISSIWHSSSWFCCIFVAIVWCLVCTKTK